MMKRTISYLLIQTLIVGVMFFGTTLPAAENDASKLKAAYVYHIAKFVQWPEELFASHKAPFKVGIIGDELFYNYLRMLTGKKIQGHTIEVKRVSGADEIKACHILYMGKRPEEEMRTLLKQLGRAPVLTVSDKEEFTDFGGIVWLHTVKNRLKMVINTRAASSRRLKIGAKLLEIAILVEAEGVQ